MHPPTAATAAAPVVVRATDRSHSSHTTQPVQQQSTQPALDRSEAKDGTGAGNWNWEGGWHLWGQIGAEWRRSSFVVAYPRQRGRCKSKHEHSECPIDRLPQHTSVSQPTTATGRRTGRSEGSDAAIAAIAAAAATAASRLPIPKSDLASQQQRAPTTITIVPPPAPAAAAFVLLAPSGRHRGRAALGGEWAGDDLALRPVPRWQAPPARQTGG